MVEGLVVDPAVAGLAWNTAAAQVDLSVAAALVAVWSAVEDRAASDQAVEHPMAADSAADFRLRNLRVANRAASQVLAPMAAVVLDRAMRSWQPELALAQARTRADRAVMLAFDQAQLLRASEPPAAELAFDRELAAEVLEDQQAALACDRVPAQEHQGLESLPPIAMQGMRLPAKAQLPERPLPTAMRLT